jgi:hypothetical protein
VQSAFYQVSFVNSDEILKAELAKAFAECERLREENARLRLRIGEDLKGDHQDIKRPSFKGDVKAHPSAAVTVDSPPEVKVSLFKDLFRARNDVYAVRWEGRNGKTGYSPAGDKEWDKAPSFGRGQIEAAKALGLYDEGVLCAPTAFGKTAIAANLIALRKVNTLVLVHRRQLMDQWRERLALFLGLAIKDIGQIGGGKKTQSGRLDLAVIQSLIRKGEVKDLVAEYGQVIVDECHHVSAFSFERVLKKVKAKYVVGLTATPVRKDGHHPIILMQCGPIRFNVGSKKQAAASAFQYEVIPRLTEFTVPPEWNGIGIQEIYTALVHDDQRSDLIVADVVAAIEDGRFPLLLTERTDHLEILFEKLVRRVPNIFVMKGGMGKKQRDALAAAICALRMASHE